MGRLIIACGPQSVCATLSVISGPRSETTSFRGSNPDGSHTHSHTRHRSPQGTWGIDTIHSSASFAAKHMVVSTFRGQFDDFDATLTVGDDGDASLLGIVKVDSIVVKDENLAGHLKSPDFFDTERHPEIRFASRRSGATATSSWSTVT